MTQQLEGAELFDAATKVVGCKRIVCTTSLVWSVLVPAMLEWLRGRCDYISLLVSENGAMAECAKRVAQWKSGPDLPTALARLVLRVAELEGKS